VEQRDECKSTLPEVQDVVNRMIDQVVSQQEETLHDENKHTNYAQDITHVKRQRNCQVIYS
jgi:hypothetical protein